MKLKKALSLILVSAMTCSLAACSGSTTTTSQNAANTDNAAGDADTAADIGTAAADADADQPADSAAGDDVKEADYSDVVPDETVTLTVYSQLSNYEGEQIGWFADILKEKFNVKMNIISNGDGVFDTRMESGNLGDIVLFGADGDEYTRAYQNGMLLDWNEDDILSDYAPYIKNHMAAALEKNAAISEGTVYGFGHDVASGAGQLDEISYHPDIRYDLYKQIGSPEINELEDYIDVLKQMKDCLLYTSPSPRDP